jgi:hypothetical protein
MNEEGIAPLGQPPTSAKACVMRAGFLADSVDDCVCLSSWTVAVHFDSVMIFDSV